MRNRPRSHGHVFLNPELLRQLLHQLPQTGEVGLHILRDVGWGGVLVLLDREECKRLILTARDER